MTVDLDQIVSRFPSTKSMTSFVKRLAQSLSIDGQSPGGAFHPHDATSPLKRISASPSFNDFSLLVEDQFENANSPPVIPTSPFFSASPRGYSSKQKIAGMDPHDLCDLLKSSSL